jgi:hypothetical protein
LRPSLTSPGRATSGRAALETEVQSEMLRSLHRFLVGVETDAVSALDAPVLLAAAVQNPGEPFTLGKVLTRWQQAVQRMMRRVARGFLPEQELTPLTETYLSGALQRLTGHSLPDLAYRAVLEVLSAGAEQMWTQRRIKRNLTVALNPDTGTALRTSAPDGTSGMTTTGQSWDDIVKRIARTEATAAYNVSQLNQLNAAGHTSKQWVSHHDKRTRHTHAEADGQVVPTDQPFFVGGVVMQYPGDPAGPARESANCRCVVVAAGESQSVRKPR